MEAVRGSAEGQYFSLTKPGVNIRRVSPCTRGKNEKLDIKKQIISYFSYLLSKHLSYIFLSFANLTLNKFPQRKHPQLQGEKLFSIKGWGRFCKIKYTPE